MHKPFFALLVRQQLELAHSKASGRGTGYGGHQPQLRQGLTALTAAQRRFASTGGGRVGS